MVEGERQGVKEDTKRREKKKDNPPCIVVNRFLYPVGTA